MVVDSYNLKHMQASILLRWDMLDAGCDNNCFDACKPDRVAGDAQLTGLEQDSCREVNAQVSDPCL